MEDRLHPAQVSALQPGRIPPSAHESTCKEFLFSWPVRKILLLPSWSGRSWRNRNGKSMTRRQSYDRGRKSSTIRIWRSGLENSNWRRNGRKPGGQPELSPGLTSSLSATYFQTSALLARPTHAYRRRCSSDV